MVSGVIKFSTNQKTVVKAVLRLRIAAPRCQSTSLVGAGMGSNPIRIHFC